MSFKVDDQIIYFRRSSGGSSWSAKRLRGVILKVMKQLVRIRLEDGREMNVSKDYVEVIK